MNQPSFLSALRSPCPPDDFERDDSFLNTDVKGIPFNQGRECSKVNSNTEKQKNKKGLWLAPFEQWHPPLSPSQNSCFKLPLLKRMDVSPNKKKGFLLPAAFRTIVLFRPRVLFDLKHFTQRPLPFH